jgi:hypothetical protein
MARTWKGAVCLSAVPVTCPQMSLEAEVWSISKLEAQCQPEHGVSSRAVGGERLRLASEGKRREFA